MCNPTAFFVVTSLLTGVQQVTQYNQQKKFARAQAAAQEQNFQSQTDAAATDAINTYSQNNLRLAQERQKGAADIQRIVRQSRVAAGIARVGAAEAGVAGDSIRTLLVDFERQAGSFRTGVQRNLSFAEQQTAAANRGAHGTYRGRVLASLPDVISMPNAFNAALSTGVGVFDAYADFSVQQPDGSFSLSVPSATSGP